MNRSFIIQNKASIRQVTTLFKNCYSYTNFVIILFTISVIEIQKGNVQLKGKHIALRRCHKGVKISGTEEVEPANSRSKYDLFPSPEVKEVQESLKSSSLELRALVKDPLPDALRTSEAIRSKLAAKDINHEPHIENQSGDVDAPDPDVCKSIVLYQPNDANLVKKSSVHCSNVHCPNLMEPNNTARTYEVIMFQIMFYSGARFLVTVRKGPCFDLKGGILFKITFFFFFDVKMLAFSPKEGLPSRGLPPSDTVACGFCKCGPTKTVLSFT